MSLALGYTLGPRTVAKISRLDLETSLQQELSNFSLQVQIGNILVFLGHMASVITLNPAVIVGEQPQIAQAWVGVAVF